MERKRLAILLGVVLLAYLAAAWVEPCDGRSCESTTEVQNEGSISGAWNAR